MTTLTENAQRLFGGGGGQNDIPVIASDIIYEHAAVGLVQSSGYARPLAAGDLFVGFAKSQVDNSAGSAADLNVPLTRKGVVTLTITGVVITDVGQPVYASDDNAFTMQPVTTTTSNTFIGFVIRWKSSGIAEVAFNCDDYVDPWGNGPREAIAANKTLDALDSGKTFFVNTDATTTTLPVTATALNCRVVNAGAYGTVAINIDPAAADSVAAPDSAGVANKDYINTKATAQRGDFVSFANGHADGALVDDQRGIWAAEA